MEIAILIFAGITALDAIGPYEVLSRIPNVQVKFVAIEKGPVKTENQMCTLIADYSLSEIKNPDVVVIPGGWGTEELMSDSTVLDWIRDVHTRSQWTVSICTGSLVLAAAGLLEGLQATSHGTVIDRLAEYGAHPTQARFVKAGKIVTSGGVCAGIDMAYQLVLWIGGEELSKTIQLSMEYEPRNP